MPVGMHDDLARGMARNAVLRVVFSGTAALGAILRSVLQYIDHHLFFFFCTRIITGLGRRTNKALTLFRPRTGFTGGFDPRLRLKSNRANTSSRMPQQVAGNANGTEAVLDPNQPLDAPVHDLHNSGYRPKSESIQPVPHCRRRFRRIYWRATDIVHNGLTSALPKGRAQTARSHSQMAHPPRRKQP